VNKVAPVLEVPVEAASGNAESGRKTFYSQAGPAFSRQYCERIFQPVFAGESLTCLFSDHGFT